MGCGGRGACEDERKAVVDGEVVWSWRPGAGAKFVRSKLLRDDGGNKPVTGESAKETVTPSRRKSIETKSAIKSTRCGGCVHICVPSRCLIGLRRKHEDVLTPIERRRELQRHDWPSH